MILQIYNWLPRISIKIQFGTPETICHVFGAIFVGSFVFALMWCTSYLQNDFGEIEKSILLARGLNVTNRPPIYYCDLPYDDCLCPILSNISDTSQKCITNAELVTSRILPLISFFLQIFLVRELFSLNTNHRRVIIYTLWFASIFTFIGMTISIYWSSCYHVHVTVILLLTGELLLFLSIHNLLVNADREASSSNLNQVIIADRSERTNNADKSCLDLL
jgi:hypothetical protein